MKIIQIMPEFRLGGAEIMCETLSTELKKNGIDVTVVSLYRYESIITKRLEEAGIRIIYLDKKPGLDLSMVKKLRNIFVKTRPDAIHTHRYVMQYAIPAAVMERVQVKVHTFHSIAQKENTLIARFVNGIFYRFFGVIPVALSENIKETIHDVYHMSENKIPVILNGIELEKCIPKNNYDLSLPIRLLHVGRFTEAKNHSELLKAVKALHSKYPNIQLNLVGDGELKHQVIEQIDNDEMNQYVELKGTTDNVFAIMKEADIFVLPSIYEGIPMTLIEAMGTGLPIVASGVGGIPNMLAHQMNGLLCDPISESIELALEKMIQDKSLRQSCGEEARISVKKFSSQEMCKRYVQLYETSKKK